MFKNILSVFIKAQTHVNFRPGFIAKCNYLLVVLLCVCLSHVSACVPALSPPTWSVFGPDVSRYRPVPAAAAWLQYVLWRRPYDVKGTESMALNVSKLSEARGQ